MAQYSSYTGASISPLQSYNMAYSQDQDALIMDPSSTCSAWDTNIDPLLRNPSIQTSSEQIHRFLTEAGSKPLFEFPNYLQNQQVFSFQQGAGIFNAPYAPTHPQIYPHRFSSPAPSASICSTGSLPMDEFWPPSGDYQNQNVMPVSSSRATPTSQGVPDLVFDRNFSFTSGCEPRSSHINMSQVQEVPDAQESYDEDTTFPGTSQKLCFINTQIPSKPNDSLSGFQYSPIEHSLPPQSSPEIKAEIKLETQYPESELDADCEAESDIDLEIEHQVAQTEAAADADDGLYQPRASKRRRITARPSLKTRSRLSKRGPASKGRPSSSTSPLQCQSCLHSPFKDTDSLDKHVKSAHTRTYVCAFAFAGCNSLFGSKNEWKRHVASQHLCLNYWECTQGACGSRARPSSSSPSSASNKSSIFNRKDLFTQHLRRMHAPAAAKKNTKKIPRWEADVSRLQAECLRIRRDAPEKIACGACGVSFEGDGAWDERMEHFARHAERGEPGDVDGGLVDWAVREGVVRSVGGRWELVGGANLGRGLEGDDE